VGPRKRLTRVVEMNAIDPKATAQMLSIERRSGQTETSSLKTSTLPAVTVQPNPGGPGPTEKEAGGAASQLPIRARRPALRSSEFGQASASTVTGSVDGNLDNVIVTGPIVSVPAFGAPGHWLTHTALGG